MAGIYIHVPFCKQACHYCDFHFSTSLRFKNDLITALCQEIEIQKDYLGKKTLKTLYFGGGTPSLLSFDELNKIITTVSKHFSLLPEAEITLEANPDDLTEEKLKNLKQLGINRLSIGIQSFYDEHLKWMNRAHTAAESIKSIKAAQDKGFDNITIDLIYGMPNLSEKQWQNNIETAISLNVPHISAYNLTVEEKTALHHFVKTGKTLPPNDETGAKHFEQLIKTLTNNGYRQYETSNFAKNGKIAQHNSSYWKGEKYIGIGPSAHSYNHKERQWNIANNKKYITAIERGEIWYEKELLTPQDKVNEHLLIGLRTIWGCDLNYIRQTLTHQQYNIFEKELQKKKTMLIQKENRIYLTEKGKHFADRIASDLFVVE